MPVHIGANSLKKPHHIVILRFSEVVKGHAKSLDEPNCLVYFWWYVVLFEFLPIWSQQQENSKKLAIYVVFKAIDN